MRKHLWNLNLDTIPLGWDSIYQTALAEYPEGTYIDPSQFEGGLPGKVIYHPVKFKLTLYSKYNFYKEQAENLYQSREHRDFDEVASTLLKYDVILFNLLLIWIQPESETDYSTFDSEKLLDDSYLLDTSVYFDSGYGEIEKYKFLNF